jgi:AcrR family transcriptional regulator
MLENVKHRAPDTSGALLAAASELLMQGGPASVTLRAVGAAAGVSRTAPYRHFRDKDDLLSAVAAQNLAFMAAAMRQAAEDGAAAGTPLYRACLGYVRAAMERPAHYRLVFGDFQINNPSKTLEDAADACVAYLYEIIAESQRDGVLVTGDVREIAALLWAALHGLVDLTLAGHLREPRTVDGTEAIPRLVALALQNLTPRSPGQPSPQSLDISGSIASITGSPQDAARSADLYQVISCGKILPVGSRTRRLSMTCWVPMW